MRNAFVTAGAALVLGGLAFAGPAQAVSPLSRHDAAPLLIPAEDIEDQEVSTISIPTSCRCRPRWIREGKTPEAARSSGQRRSKDRRQVEEEELADQRPA